MPGPASAKNEDSQHPELNRVAVRIPPFWPEDPEMWFAQVEHQFLIAGIVSEDTKFGYVVGNLDAKYMKEAKDILINPPQTDKYSYLKTELIKRLSMSQQEKIRRLFELEEMGDRKPSQFLRHLQGLASTDMPDNFIRSIWLSRLPANMQAILATQAKADLTTAAELADAVAETTAGPHLAETSAATSRFEAILEQVTSRMDEMTTQIAALSKRHRSPVQESTRFRSTSRPRQRAVTRDTWCWYHARFKDKARKCEEPCTYNAENCQGSR